MGELSPEAVLRALVGLLPVLCFLAALLYLDSYKLLKLRFVIALVTSGVVVAGVSYVVNIQALALVEMDMRSYTRYVSPLLEELLKGLVIYALIRAHRIGFLVDAAIAGFAVGTGFALVENLYYLYTRPEAGMGIWIVRGFGTAIMHGGATALLAVTGLARLEQAPGSDLTAPLPGYAVAVVLHSAFNHFFLSPIASALGILVVLPPLFHAAFRRSERAVGQWLGQGFDADVEMLELIDSGRFSGSPMGQYLHEMRAKGILMMRESGFEVPVDEATREKFAEMRYLEKSIGRTGLLAMQPLMRMSHKDLWQLYMLGK